MRLGRGNKGDGGQACGARRRCDVQADLLLSGCCWLLHNPVTQWEARVR